MPETPVNSIRDLAAEIRGRRKSLRLSQAALAKRARVSRPWLSELESGKSTVEIGLVLRVLAALEIQLRMRVEDADKSKGEAPATGVIELDSLLNTYRER